MSRSPARIAIAVVVFAVALGGGLLLLRNSSPDPEPKQAAAAKDAAGTKAPAALESDIWAVGDTWTVTVLQDSGAISPDGGSVAGVPFDFEVTDAPTKAGEPWKVTVTQDGAEGPFADGWRLQYVAKGDDLVLYRVATGKETPLEAELASIVLGAQFPYETKYSAPPKDATIKGSKLLDRAQLPPGSLPSGGSDGASPPAEAPPIDENGMPKDPVTAKPVP